MVIGFGDLRRGIAVELDGVPHKVEEYSQQKMQQRAPTYHLKLRNLITGQQVERSFSGYGMRLARAPVANRATQYLYEADGLYYFMDTTTYDQYPVDSTVVGEAVNYLVDQGEAELVFWKDAVVAIELPTTVTLEVTEAPPGYRGDTATAGTKPATVETGLSVNVPMFISAGDKVKVDTRNGAYVERV